jgi:exopolysaccharide biosynthesis polyprenyl glycosylphosphotransferase
MIRLFSVFIPVSVLALLLSDIGLLYFCFIVPCYIVLDADPYIFLLVEGGLEKITFVVASILVGVYLNDLYSRFRVRSRTELFQQFCVAVGTALLIQALVSYVDRNWILSRYVMLPGCLLTLAIVPLWRMAYSAILLRVSGRDTVLYVGRSPVVEKIARRLAEYPELGFGNLGYVDDNQGDATDPLLPWLGAVKDLSRVAEEKKAQRIVVGVADRRQSLPIQQLLELRQAGRAVDEAATMYEIAFSRVSSSELRLSEFVFSDRFGPSRGSAIVREFYSLAVALTAVVLLAPLMLVVAVLIKLTSQGPVLYRQMRVGLNGKPFVLYKFRSMRQDAEAETGAVWAAKDDPRVTPLGRWLRRLRIDEVPQLFNVLRGEMAIVGPRPERPEFVKTLIEKLPFYQQRHSVRPGITGWAQINHKYTDTLEDTLIKLEYDLYYIKNMSLALDGYIIFQTAKVMLLSRGAQ